MDASSLFEQYRAILESPVDSEERVKLPAKRLRVLSDITIRKNDVYLPPGCVLEVPVGVVVTFEKPFHAGRYQVFDITEAANLVFSKNAVPDKFLPQWLGAKADNTNDDSTTINQAIQIVYNSGTGIVYLAPGQYLCEDTLELKEGVNLIGAGRIETKINRGSAAGNVIRAYRNQWWKISDISIDTNGMGDGIYAPGCWNYEISRIRILNAPAGSAGIHVYFEDTNSGNSRGVIRVIRCEECDVGIWFEGQPPGSTAYITTTLIENCFIKNSTEAYKVRGDLLVFLNCSAQGFTDRGFRMNGNDNIIIGGLIESNICIASAIGLHHEAGSRAKYMPGDISMNAGTDYQDDGTYTGASARNRPFKQLGKDNGVDYPPPNRFEIIDNVSAGSASLANLEWGAQNTNAVNAGAIYRWRWAIDSASGSTGQFASLIAVKEDGTEDVFLTIDVGKITIGGKFIVGKFGTTANLASTTNELMFTPAEGEVWEIVISGGLTPDKAWRCVAYTWTDAAGSVVNNLISVNASVVVSGSALHAQNDAGSSQRLNWRATRRV